MSATLQGPPVSEREQLMLRAYQFSVKEEWFEAIAAFDELLALPDHTPHDRGAFLSSQATCLMNVGLSHQAAENYEAALALRPERKALMENIIFCRDHCADTTAAEALRLRRSYWAQHGAAVAAKHQQPHLNDLDPERPLRIGYVSGDFRSHSANMAFGAIVIRHTPAVEVVCYNTAPANLWDHFTTIYSQEKTLRVIEGVGDDIAASIIRRDKIDILVDLSAYSNGGRLGIFCMKPAPIQATAWGYILGTGCDPVDYIFGDPIAMPFGDQENFTERIVHLPCLIPFIGQMYAPDVTLLPSVAVKPTVPFTFGVFRRPAKITDGALRCWAKILAALPESRLLFKDTFVVAAYHRDRILAALGVAPDRVLFEGQTPHRAHLEAWGRVDLALDTFPIAGGIEVCEALWQGVPVIIRHAEAGSRVTGRVGESVLTVLGMDDFIAKDDEDYVALAVRWATEGRLVLADWRARLRTHMFKSPMIQGYVEAVEATYRDLWREWVTSQLTARRVSMVSSDSL